MTTRKHYGLCLFALLAGLSPIQRTFAQDGTKDLVIGDFDGKDYGNWKVEGEAFGSAPARGSVISQEPLSGFEGKGLANSYHRGDDAQGTLTSPAFTISKPFINFLVGGGNRPGEADINLLIDGQAVATATGRDSETLSWDHWDVSALQGKTATVQIRDRAIGGWAHITVDQISQSDTAKGDLISAADIQQMLKANSTALYDETYRPQFHFTAAKNWLSDPTGLVFYQGEYHLFFLSNPDALTGPNVNTHWSHAVSTDLVHWKELPVALSPIGDHQRYSGSTVVDWKNTSGLGTGTEPPLVAINTLSGQGEALSYSNDHGRTWKDYTANPVLGIERGDDRGSKVFWNEASQRWLMVLYGQQSFGFYESADLKKWNLISRVEPHYENPDFFSLPVDGNDANRKWVLVDGNGYYQIGDFDGREFTPRTPHIRGDLGRNYYATQTWNDIPAADGRRIQIAWMNGGVYPHMPFSQQLTFPCQLSLRTFPEGIRLCKVPVAEIQKLYDKTTELKDQDLNPGQNPLSDLKGDTFHITAEIALGTAREVGFEVRGQRVYFARNEMEMHGMGDTFPYYPQGKTIKFELLLDRTSLESFIDDGRFSSSSAFTQSAGNRDISVFANGGTAKIVSLQVHALHSAWTGATQ